LPVETLKQWNNIKGDAVKSGTKLIIGYLKVKKELSGLAKNGVGASIGSNAVITAKPEEKKTLPAEPAPIPVEKKEVIQPVVKETPKEPVKPVVEKPVVETKRANPVASSNGTFKDQYGSQTKNSQSVEESGTAGVFKSSSGWTDKKYYCLYNSASQGTIIKISNPANGKFVFAKVLDMMPDIKQNEGLLITISNAAADELGASGNFNCTISYSK
ncbi:MAG TPA: hypothetical protein VHL77_13210, partial [Ferruginibacter sp.]|nr:hypothetical protein [Ferruginibacter sp.]